MKIMISNIADEFDTQRGAVFRIGTLANDDIGYIVKISILIDEDTEQDNNCASCRREECSQSQQWVKNEWQKEYGECLKKNDS